jgi:hypothetical protein
MGRMYPAVFDDVFDDISGHMQYSVSAVPGLEGNNECKMLMVNFAASEGSSPNRMPNTNPGSQFLLRCSRKNALLESASDALPTAQRNRRFLHVIFFH